MRRSSGLLLLILAGAAAQAFAAEPDVERRLRLLLFQHHGPPDAATFTRHVPDAKRRLLALASDGRAHAMTRDRALVALAAFGGEDVRLL